MKKVICTLLILTLAFFAVGCGNSEGETGDKPETATSGKTLVVYYSATGNTKDVADVIAQNLEADVFEIVPQEPYTSEDLNWNDDDSRVSIEHNDESKRNVPLAKSVPDNWSEYDTVYIGYPIWWGVAAWPVNQFIADNDFEGKTVIPFCTSASSSLGDSGNLLKEAAGSGNWLDGKRFASGASQDEIIEWIGEIDG